MRVLVPILSVTIEGLYSSFKFNTLWLLWLLWLLCNMQPQVHGFVVSLCSLRFHRRIVICTEALNTFHPGSCCRLLWCTSQCPLSAVWRRYQATHRPCDRSLECIRAKHCHVVNQISEVIAFGNGARSRQTAGNANPSKHLSIMQP